MAQVSRKPISGKFYNEIFQEFSWILTDIKEEKEMELFLDSFLTPTEKIMLTKRFVLAILILRGWDWYAICQLLHVSSATVSRMRQWLSVNGTSFQRSLEKLEKKERWDDFWKKVDDIVSYLPSSKSDMRGRARLIYGKGK